MSVLARDLESVDGLKNIHWREEGDPRVWDQALARLGGHPLQSALWGNARRAADGIEDWRLIGEGGGILLMARIELRHVPLLGGRLGWIPRGPTGAGAEIDRSALSAIVRETPYRLALVVTDRWHEAATADQRVFQTRPETIWIDLSAGKDHVWQGLDRQWRYGVGKARRMGVTVVQSRSDEDAAKFVQLAKRVGAEKKFESAVSAGALHQLLAGDPDAPVSAHLFVARCDGAFAAGALIFRSGLSAHYLSGVTDRRHSRYRVGEALHWSIIEWAISQGLTLYDLEGIDRRRNPGTFAFKKKMGGREVVLVGKHYLSFSGLGVLVAALDRCRERLNSAFSLPRAV